MSGSIILGRVRPKDTGNYNPDRAYDVLERVKYKGQIYECAVKTTAGIAPDSTENGSVYWSQISVNNPIPQAVWDGTELSFEYPDGEKTEPVDLQGPQGEKGDPGEVELTSDLTSTAPDVALSALGGNRLLNMIESGGNGGVSVLDEPIDFSDQEQITELIENVPKGHIFAYPCGGLSSEEEITISGNFNTREVINESGEWTAPVTGTYKITVIGGGTGGLVRGNADYSGRIVVRSGNSGEFFTTFKTLQKGQVIPVTIGAGGLKRIDPILDGNAVVGGITSFGDITAGNTLNYQHVPYKAWIANELETINSYPARIAGAGPGAMFGGTPNTPGTGGSAQYEYNLTEETYVYNANDGAAGCVILEYYDAAKDKNISVDMASSVTMAELAEQIKALSARVKELENE